MKKIQVLVFCLLVAVSGFSQQQILVASDGTNATFDIGLKKHEFKELVILATVKWVDVDLKQIANENSILVLKKSDIKITANQPVEIEEFLTKTEIRFHDQAELHISYKGARLNEVKIEILPSYSISKDSPTEAFIMAYPEKFSKTISKLVGPEIVLTSPEKGRGMNPLIEEPKVKIEGYIRSEIPIKSLTINDMSVKPDDKGAFTYNLSVESKGKNPLLIIATDETNNISKVDMVLDYRPPLTEQNLTELKYYALIIASEQYEDQKLVDLDYPIDDATALYKVLTTKYTYEPEKIMFLKDATNKQIVQALDSLTHIITDYDNLLIFYAGHGYWDPKTEIGYWLPANTDMSDKSTWFRNSSLRDYIESIKSNHTLLIADACFSGGIFKTRGAFDNASVAITKLYNMPSRKAMTSGNLTEVPDKSIFMKYLIKQLEINQKDYISTAELFNDFRDAVLNNSPNIPQYGTIQNSGDEGGEFIFIKRK